jgi:ketosteroid isomerase-like protein
VSESRNAAIARSFIDAFNRVDVDAALADADPDIVLKEWVEAPGARTYHGFEGVRTAISNWFESWEWMQVEIKDIADVGDDRVLLTVYQQAKGAGSGIEVDLTTFNVYRFRDGKVTGIELYIERDAALEAAGLTPNYEKEKS